MGDPRVVVAFDADFKGLTAGASGASGVIRSFDKDLTNVSGTATKLDAGLKAFSWTTFAGGALNVTTALAQVYTSLSNLDRVQLQVKNSMVGVERAEDLLAKKTSMLNAEMSKHGLLSEKSIRLRNEIATATDDLANKEEKLRLAQDQVNDTYILFGTNIVNTLFGTIQTLAGLKAMLAIKSLAVATAIDKETISIAANNAVGAVNIGIQTGMVASRGAMGGMIPALITKQDYLTKSGGALNTVMGAGVLGSGKLASGLNKLMTPAGGAGIAMLALSAALFTTGKSMDEMDGVVDNLYTRFYNVSLQTDAFGKSIDALVDRGDAMTVFGHKLAESLSFGMYNAPNLEKFAKQDATKMLKDLGPVFGKGLTIDSSVEDITKAINKKLEASEIFQANKRKTLIEDTFAQQGMKGLLDINATPEEIQIIKGFYDDVVSRSQVILDLAEKQGDAQITVAEAIETAAEGLQKELDLTHDITENIKKSALESLKFNDIKASGNRSEEDSLRIQEQAHRRIEEIKKNEIYKQGIDVIEYSKKFPNLSESDRMNFDSQSNRGMVLNITGVDLGEIANTLALPDAIKKANMHTFLSQYQKFPAGGKTDGVLDYLDKQASEYIKKTNNIDNAHKLYEMTGGKMGIKSQFGTGFFKSTGATAAYQVPRGSIRASSEFYENLKKIDNWNNSQAGQDIKLAASNFISVSGAWYTGKNKSQIGAGDSNAMFLAGALGFKPSNVDPVDGIINTSVGAMISESNAFLSTRIGSIPASMLSSAMNISIQKGQEASRGYLSNRPQYRSGTQMARSQGAEAGLLQRQTSASLFNNISSRFNGGNYGEYDATVMSSLLGATFAHPEIAQEYTSFQTKIAPILGITHNEFTSVLSESARGFSEIDDRMRYKGRLEQISTGATVF